MSYNGNRDIDKNTVYDDMNIKSHLNTSLELEGISVSEELFQRTLATIREQQAQQEEHGEAKVEEGIRTKNVPWNRYVRSFAGVAAALLLLVVGYNVIKQMPIVKNDTTSMDSAAPEDNLMMSRSAAEDTQANITAESPEAAEAPAAANAGIAAKEAKLEAQNEASEYTISAENTADAGDNVSAGTDDISNYGKEEGTEEEIQFAMVPEDDSNSLKFSTSLQSTDASEVTYTFRNIFLPAPEEAEYITISSNKSGTSVTLTAQEDIRAFYLVMDAHLFTGDAQKTENGQDYTVEMKNPNTQTLYTMYLGPNLIVKCIQGDNVTENLYYPDDETLLKQEIESFLLEHSE